jgi:hypothetical protein
MGRPAQHPLRALTLPERAELEALARSRSAPADRIVRAQEILVVADGATFVEAARRVGRRSNDCVSALVARFNGEGLQAVWGHHGGGPARQYGPQEQARILKEFARTPDRETDGTATWSLTTLQRALRRAEDGLPRVSTYVILQTLHQAGYTWQRDRTWCFTGSVLRQRKDGVVLVTDAHATEKRGRSSRRILQPRPPVFPSGVKTKPDPIKPSHNRVAPGKKKANLLCDPMSISEGARPSY